MITIPLSYVFQHNDFIYRCLEEYLNKILSVKQ